MSTVSNKILGNQFEIEFCEELSRRGWWVCRMAPNAAGQQPMDILAIRDGNPKMIDCKVCTGKRFLLSRIEANQRTSAWKWESCGNGEAWIAIKVIETDEVWMIEMSEIERLIHSNFKSIPLKDIADYGYSFDTWWED